MSHRLFARAGTVVAASLALVAAGPALAAAPVAQASATALRIAVGGQGTDTGAFTATHDGTRETTSGTHTAAVTAGAGQRLANLGTVAQDATAGVVRSAGNSAACAGIAGAGATVAQAGDAGTCLAGGQTMTLDAAHLDLTNLTVADGDALKQLSPTLTSQLLGPVSGALQQVLGALGNPALGVDLGVVEASCAATPERADGTSTIADAAAYVDAPAPIGRIDLVRLPAHPAPNTHVVTDLSAVAEAIQRAVDTQLATAIGGQSGPLGPLLTPLGLTLDQVIDQVQANVTDALGPQLAPLEQNVLDIELNHQQRRSPNAIDVTALDLSVLPAARQVADGDLASLVVGDVTCGPNRRVAAAPAPAVQPPVVPAASVPTSVESGAASLQDDPSPVALGALAGLVTAGAGAGAWGFRRRLQR